MTDLDLVRRLRRLYRTALMLQTELRHQHLDTDLIAQLDLQLEDGVATEPRCTALRGHVDSIRENTLTPRTELFGDTIRACEDLKDAIDGLLGRIV